MFDLQYNFNKKKSEKSDYNLNHCFDCEHICRKLTFRDIGTHQIHLHKIVLNFFYIELLIVFKRKLFSVHLDFYHARISYFYLMGIDSKCWI